MYRGKKKKRKYEIGYHINEENAIKFENQGKSRGQVKAEAKKRRKYAEEMRNTATRIQHCKEYKEQYDKENLELLTTGQEEVRKDLTKRGLIDSNGNINLENLDISTGYNKDYTPEEKEKPKVFPMDNSPIVYYGSYINRLNMQKHFEREIAKAIEEEGQAVMIKKKSLEHTEWDHYHTYVKHHERPREDFVYHKVIPPEQAITIHPELIGVQYRGKSPIMFTGCSIPWNRQKASLDLREYVFYQECKMNPNVHWLKEREE